MFVRRSECLLTAKHGRKNSLLGQKKYKSSCDVLGTSSPLPDASPLGGQHISRMLSLSSSAVSFRGTKASVTWDEQRLEKRSDGLGGARGGGGGGLSSLIYTSSSSADSASAGDGVTNDGVAASKGTAVLGGRRRSNSWSGGEMEGTKFQPSFVRYYTFDL
jgi:hypothetical protein